MRKKKKFSIAIRHMDFLFYYKLPMQMIKKQVGLVLILGQQTEMLFVMLFGMH